MLTTQRLNMGMIANLWGSAATFKHDTVQKASFVLLSLLDLTLTVLAASLGFQELNPVVQQLVGIPVLLMVVKLAVPLVIAWLVPGRLLLPSIGLLGLVAVWNIKELLISLL